MKKKIFYLLLPIFAVSLLTDCASKEPVGKEFTVTFVSNVEGSPVPPPQKVRDGYTATRPSDPSYVGWDFVNWYLDDITFGYEYDFKTAVRSDLTLYAKWDVAKCTVTFDSKGGTPVDPITTDFDHAIDEPDEPTYGAREFCGWYTEDDKKFDFSQKIQDSITLHAVWDIKESTTRIAFKDNVIGKTVAFNYEGELESVTWGDGTENTSTSHEYATGSVGNIQIKGKISSISLTDSETGEPLADNGRLTIEHLELGEGLLSIPDYAFSGMSFFLRNIHYQIIEMLEIPENMEYIGSHAFAGTKTNGLKSVKIPTTVATIKDNVFSGSEFVDIYCKAEAKPEKWDKNWAGDESIINICWGVLDRLKDQDFTYVALTDGTASIEKYTGGASDIITIPETLPSTDGGSNVTVKTIGPLVEANANTIEIPNTVTTICASAFKGMYNIKQIDIPRSVKTIGDQAFMSIGAKSIVIPDTVINMGSKVFENSSLSTIFCEPDTKPSTWKNDWGDSTKNNAAIYWGYKDQGDVDGYNYVIVGSDSNREAYITSYTGEDGAIIIPETIGEDQVPVTRICKDAFRENENITSVVFPNSVTTIDDYAFYKCKYITSITLSNNLKHIGEYAFYQMPLSELIIPGSVDTIGQNAFCNYGALIGQVCCESLEKPEGWAENWLTNRVFNLYWGYKSKGTTEDGYLYVETQEGTYIAGHTETGQDLALDIPASIGGEGKSNAVIGISNRAFYMRADIISLQMPEGMISIGDEAFSFATDESSKLTGEIRFPSSLKKIGSNAFTNPGNGAEFYLGKNLTTIGGQAFGKNGYSYKTEHIDIYCSAKSKPDGWSDNWCDAAPQYASCTTIHWDCISRGVDVDSGLTFIEHDDCIEIDGCIDGLKNVVIPEEINAKPVEIIGECAFYDGGYSYDGKLIETIYIPNSVKKIGAFAFAYCPNLKRVYIPESVEEVGNRAFIGVTGAGGLYEMLYCGVSSKPENWDSTWNANGFIDDVEYSHWNLVTWGVSRSVDETSGFEYIDVTGETGKSNAHVMRYLGSDEVVNVPETINGLTVNYIDATFYNNQTITSVILPNTISTIAAGSFASCGSLQTINLTSYIDGTDLPSAHINAFDDSVIFIVSSNEVRDALIAKGGGWPTDTARYRVSPPPQP